MTGDGQDVRPVRAAKPKRKEPEMKEIDLSEGMAKFSSTRQTEVSKKGLKNLRLKKEMAERQKIAQQAVKRMAENEVLLTEEQGYVEAEGREKTVQFSQGAIANASDLAATAKRFELDLSYGGYKVDYTRNGRHMLLGGAKGHVAFLDCQTMMPLCELHLDETIRDVKTLQSHTMFAVCQKKYTYIYDSQGVELHCLREQRHQHHLEYLPYHFLLASAGERGDIHWRDISTGTTVARHQYKGLPFTMRKNEANGVLHMGYGNGVCALWTPNVAEPVMRGLCHKGPIAAMAIKDPYMATAGMDGRLKIWDLRKWGVVDSYPYFGDPPSTMDWSMTGMLAVGNAAHVTVWKDVLKGKQQRPYLEENLHGKTVAGVRFRPYEDVLGVGHAGGVAAMLVPGCGLANIDAFVANPDQSKKARQEHEIRQLLEKLQPDSIMLDPGRIGMVDAEASKIHEARVTAMANAGKRVKKKVAKKQRGKSKAGNKQKAAQKKTAGGQREVIKKRLKADGEQAQVDAAAARKAAKKAKAKAAKAAADSDEPVAAIASTKGALARFSRKKTRAV